jgi:hypothetical protein
MDKDQIAHRMRDNLAWAGLTGESCPPPSEKIGPVLLRVPLRARVRRKCREVCKSLLRPPARVGAFVLRRLWRWAGNPLRDPITELLAHARRTEALVPVENARDQEHQRLLQLVLEQTRSRFAVANQLDRLRLEQTHARFEIANQLDQVRRACAGVLAAVSPAASEEPPIRKIGSVLAPARNLVCCVCGGTLSFKWRRRVLSDRYEAQYYECVRCAALQIPAPTWLEEAYRNEDQPRFWNPDGGRFIRNFSVYSHLCAFRDSGVLTDESRLLDYGGGFGLLARMLLDGGFDAWQADPYVNRPFFGPERHIADLRAQPTGAFDAVTAFEVLEHLTDPIRVGDELRRLLKPGGVAVFSTGIYRAGIHGPDWPYLSTESGQHVTFWSRQALSHFAARLGFRSVGYSPGAEGFNIVCTESPADDLRARLARAAKLLCQPDFLGRATRCWELTHRGDCPISPMPLVEPARLCDTEVACAS